MPSTMPRPARRIGAITSGFFNAAPSHTASGVCTGHASVSSERVTSYTIKVATSARRERNCCEPVVASRISVSFTRMSG